MAAMVVKDECLYHVTNDLILSKPRRLYPHRPTRRNHSHWQLRSLLSSPTQDIVYYPDGFDVISLNVKTRERNTIATLSFSPKCLTVSKGLICCGGEKGDPNYAAISLGANLRSLSADADARLPLDLSLPGTSSEQHLTASAPRADGTSISIKYSRIGADIVNCITIWDPPEFGSERIYDRPVAVVSNNDCSVWILDLHKSEVLEDLSMPDCVNRSVLSPSGEYLVSLCDDPYLYVHERKSRTTNRSESSAVQNFEWSLACKIPLKGQRPTDESKLRGSFAACFSSNGKYLAVATQYGIISIFDMDRIMEYDCCILTFTNSRPGKEEGAVRDMAFSPGPFDLLAWTESSGRVAVADVRNSFYSRQLLILNPGDNSADQVMVSDRQTEMIDPRLRTLRTGAPRITTPDYLGLGDLRRGPLGTASSDMFSELEVLEAHRDARRQRDAAIAARDIDHQSGLERWRLLSENQRTLFSINAARAGRAERNNDRPISTAGLPAPLREFVASNRGPHSLRSFMRERNTENERRIQQADRASVATRNALNVDLDRYESEFDRALGHTRNVADGASSLERLTLSQSRTLQQNEGREGEDDYNLRLSMDSPLGNSDRLYRDTTAPSGRSARLRIEFENENDRDFAHRLRQPWRPMGSDTSGMPDLVPYDDVHGDRLPPLLTRGLSWSEDGRILYVAIEAGVYEFHVNVLGRKSVPSLVPR